jgi:glutaminyl-tRNA synthetase
LPLEKLLDLNISELLRLRTFFYCSAVKVHEGKITEVVVEFLEDSTEKPKSYLHWISSVDAVDCQINLYDVLFNEYNPNELEDYLSAINKDSLIVKTGCKMHKNLLSNFSFFVLFFRG